MLVHEVATELDLVISTGAIANRQFGSDGDFSVGVKRVKVDSPFSGTLVLSSMP